MTVVYSDKIYQDLYVYEFLFHLQWKDQKKKLGQPVQIESPSSLPRAVGHHSGSAFLRPRKGDAESNGKGAPQDQSGVHHGKQSKKTTGRTRWHILPLLVYKVRVSMGIVH